MRRFLTLTRHSREQPFRRARQRRLIAGGNDMGALKDIVLRRSQMMRLHRLVTDARNAVLAGMQETRTTKTRRGEGTTAVFDGAKNADKMVAARGLATALKVDLYRIGPEGITEKIIGETEKNLTRLLDNSDGTQAILFFDEADALFGKRTGVTDSYDRYANLETNYLLRRISSYPGVTILSISRKSNSYWPLRGKVEHAVTFDCSAVNDDETP